MRETPGKNMQKNRVGATNQRKPRLARAAMASQLAKIETKPGPSIASQII